MSGERNGIWARILATVIPLAVAGLIAYGTLRSDVDHNSAALDKKADAITMNVQYDAILRELAGLRADIADLKRRQP